MRPSQCEDFTATGARTERQDGDRFQRVILERRQHGLDLLRLQALDLRLLDLRRLDDAGDIPGGRRGGVGRWTAAVIPIPPGVRVWIATGHTDMRRGMNSLALLVQEAFRRDPHSGDLYVFRGKSGKLIKILWHDGLGMSLYAKRLDRGKFIWPSASDGAVSISAAQMAYMLEGIDWRMPQHTWRPQAAG